MNVLFKKGLLTELFNSDGSIKSGITPVNGAIYFALNKSDTGEERGKLYLGEDNKLIPVGEDVVLKTVDSTNNLPTASLHKDEFYYCTTGNILAYSNGSNWVQVNTNTALTVSGQNIEVSGSSNSATVASTVADTAGHSSEGSFTLTGTDNVTITTSGNNISIAARDTLYDLAATSAGTDAASNNRSLGANINLSGTVSGATGTVSTDTVTIKSTSSVVASVNGNGEIELAVDTSGVGSVTGVDFGGGQVTDDHDGLISGTTSLQGFHLSVSSTTSTYADNLNPGISIKNAAGAVEKTVKFVSSALDSKEPVAALDVYSTSAVNDKIDALRNTINAMTYRGSAASITDILNFNDGEPRGLHNGDVFIASGDINFTGYDTDAETMAHEGYLIIVTGEETDGVITDPSSATYTVLKSNDTDTTYTVSGITNGIQINEVINGSPDAIGSLTISEGTAISVSDSGTSTKTVTVSHANVAHTTSTATVVVTGTSTSNANGSILTSFNTITGVTVNDQGHVTNVTTSTIQVTDTQLKDVSTSVTATGSDLATGYSAVASITVEDTAGNGDTASISLQSNTLEMAASGSQIAINLVWGTF